MKISGQMRYRLSAGDRKKKSWRRLVAVFFLCGAFSSPAFAGCTGAYTWTQQTNSGSRAWYGIAETPDGQTLVAQVYGGYIYISTDGGVNWTQQTAAGSRNWYMDAVISSNGQKIITQQYNGLMYQTANGGGSWASVASAGSALWTGLAGSSDGTKLMASLNGGNIYTSTDSGATWVQRTASGTRIWQQGAASSSDGTKLAAAAYDGNIYTSTDSGVTWTTRAVTGSTNMGDVASSSDGNVLLAMDMGPFMGSGGYMYLSTNSGASWTQLTSLGVKFWDGAAISGDGLTLIGGVTAGGLYVSINGGSSWTLQAAAGNRNWADTTASSDGSKLAAIDLGGYVWTGVCTPPPDTTPDAFSFTDVTGATTSTLTTSNIIQITGITVATSTSISGSGGEYRICSDATCSTNPAWGTAVDAISNNQYLQLRLTSSASISTAMSTTMTIGAITDNWSVTTAASDTTPDSFNFTDVTGAATSTLTPSNILQITGLSGASATSISGSSAEYRICSDATCSTNPAWGTAASTINNNQYLQLRLTSSAAISTAISTTMSIGGITDNWSVTTTAPDSCPASWTASNTCGGTTSATTSPGSQAACNSWCSTQFGTYGSGCCDWRAGTGACRYRTGTLSSNVNFQGKICGGIAGSCNITAGTTWSASGNSCTVPSTINILDGGNQVVTDSSAPTTGSITYSCASGVPSTSGAVCNDVTPNLFDFTDQTNVAVNTIITSDTVTVSGFTGPLDMVATANTKISINGGAFSALGATVAFNPGDTVVLQVTSSAANSTTVTASVTLGTWTVDWAVTTIIGGTCNDVTSGLVGHWPLDETSGTSIAETASSFPSTWQNGTGVTPATGQIGGALTFGTAANDYISALSPAALDNLSPVTICSWVKPNALSYCTAEIIVGKTPGFGQGKSLYTLSNNTVRFFSNRNDEKGSGGSVLSSGWNFVCATWSGADGTAGIDTYLNGSLITTTGTSTSGTTSDDSAVDLTIGYGAAGGLNTGCRFVGELDDVRIYNRVLSASEVADLYLYGNSGGACLGDTTPNAFSFTDVTGATVSTLTPSNIIQITGLTGAAATSISGGSAEYRVCADATCSTSPAFITTASTITNNQYLQLRLTSSASASTAISTTMMVGGVTDSWSVTTAAGSAGCSVAAGVTWTVGAESCTNPTLVTLAHLANQVATDSTTPTTGSITYSCNNGSVSISAATCNDVTPDTFDFTDTTGAVLNTAITSNTITVAGFTGPMNMVAGANTKISKNGGAFSAAGATVAFSPNDTVALQVTSSASNSTAVTATITFGTASVNWQVTTIGASCSFNTLTPHDSNRDWLGIAMTPDGTKLAAVVNGGQIYTSTNSGSTWTARATSRPWIDIAMSNDGTKMAAVVNSGAAANRRVHTSTDSGVTWAVTTSPAASWHDIAMSADGTKMAASVNGALIYTSANSGGTWTATTASGLWEDIAMSADGTKIAAADYGGSGRISISTDSGATWAVKDSVRNWNSIAMTPDGTKMVASVTNGQLYTSTDGGNTWIARESNRDWQNVAISSDGTTMAANVVNGPTYYSRDSGVTWTATGNSLNWYGMALTADGLNLAATARNEKIYTSNCAANLVTTCRATTLVAGNDQSCAVKSDGSLACWGNNTNNKATPPVGTDYTAVIGGADHGCALKMDGSIACWGQNSGGQATPPTGSNFVAIDSRWDASCALRSDSSIVCWSAGYSAPAGNNYTYVTTGWQHGCAIKTDGTLTCFGDNTDGRATPPSGNNYLTVSAGAAHNCALKADGSLACWGYNGYGQTNPPVGNNFVNVESGDQHSCAVKTDGSIACWGRNTDGESTPPAGNNYVVAVCGGGGFGAYGHSCALKTDGTVACWGRNTNGQSTPPVGLIAKPPLCTGIGTTPNPFGFTDVTGATASTLTTSNIIQITGVSAPTATSISGGSAEYRVCTDATCSTNPAWGTAASTINNNQYLQLRLTSSASASTAISTTMTVGGITDNWSVTTAAAPSGCSIPAGTTWVVGANTCTVPSLVTLAHMGSQVSTDSTAPTTGSITYSCNNGTPSTSLATCDVDMTPDVFDFTDVTGSVVSTVTTSNTVTVSGFAGPLNAVAGANTKISINGGAFSALGATVAFNPGDTMALQITSSASTSTAVTATVTLGTASVNWSVTTSSSTCTGATSLYIADTPNHRIRKVDVATGIITTIAGTGVSGYSGDGGPATSAKINTPYGITVDSSGNLYFADEQNHRIRKIDATTGIISTVAGTGSFGFNGDSGAATSAQLNTPTGVLFDSTGNLYIADNNNGRIRKINMTTGIISTMAGNGTVGYSGDGSAATSAQIEPTSIGIDSSNNIYFADNGFTSTMSVVRKINASNGIISTVAGTGVFSDTGDGGLATAATMSGPAGVSFDLTGEMYITVTSGNRIRKVNTSGIISTIAGNGTDGFSGDGAAATSAQINYPYNSQSDCAGNHYIADTSNCRIRRVDKATGIITTVAGTGACGYTGDGGAATSTQLHNTRFVLPYPPSVTGNGIACPFGPASWTVSGATCTGFTPAGNAAATQSLTDSTGVSLGAATFLCNAATHSWVEQPGATCANTGSSNCAASWTTGQICGGNTQITSPSLFPGDQAGCDAYCSNQYDTFGSGCCDFRSSDGRCRYRDGALSASGTHNGKMCSGTPPPPSGCTIAAGTTWVVGANTCTVPTTLNIAHMGSQVSTDSTVPTTGSITYSCNNGTPSTSLATCDVDTTPDAFDFTDVPGAVVSTVTSSDTVTVSGFAGPLNAVAGANTKISKNGGVFSALGATVAFNAGDTMALQVTSSASAGTPVTATITFGTLSVDWQVTTATAGATCPAALVHHWKLDENPVASPITDSAGSAHGTATTAFSSIVGKIGRAIYSNGPEAVNVGTVPEIVNKQKFTLSTWIKRDSTNAQVLLTNQIGGDTTHYTAIEVWSDGNIYLGMKNGAGGGEGSFASNDTSWHHIVMVFDGTQTGNANRLKAYLDGAPVALSYNGTIPATSANVAYPLKFGMASVSYTVGAIDDVQIYSDALTASQVANLYTLSNAGITCPQTSNYLYIADYNNHRVRQVNQTTGIIKTIAGTGAAGYNGDNIPANTAQINYPTGLAFDSAGNLYIAEEAGNRIRKVNGATGIITTVAGTGTGGFNGNGIAATAAQIDSPTTITLDSSDNIYIADDHNDMVRKVTAATGLISTYAGTGVTGHSGDGGAATSANISGTDGLAIDSTGNLYIAEGWPNYVRKVTPGGIISTIAGDGTDFASNDGIPAVTAQIDNPQDICVDPAGNVYISEWEVSNRVRKITVASGLISTVAGQKGIGGYSGDGGLATSARLWHSTFTWIDSAGNLYIGDEGYSVVRKVTPGGTISTIAGTGTGGYSGDGGLATSAQIDVPDDLVSGPDIFFADTTPTAFSFTDVTGATVNTLTASNIIQITGINAPTTTSISGGSAEYRICADATCSTNPAWGTGASTINNNQYLQLRLTSSASASTAVSTTMTVGSVTDNWSVTTAAPSAGCTVTTGTTWVVGANTCTVPTTLNIAHLGSQLATDATAPTTGTVTYTCNNGVASTSGAVCNNMLPFDFTDVAGATAGVQYSDSATVSGVTGTQTATVIGTTDVLIRKNGTGAWGLSVSISNGDTLNIQMNASNGSGAPKVATVIVGGLAVDWVVTTACGP